MAHDFQELRALREIRHEGVDLGLARGQLDDESLDRRIEDPPAAANHLSAHGIGLSRGHAQLEQHQFALEVLAAGHVQHLHDVHELVQLVDDLLDDQVRALGHQSQSRDCRVIGGGDRERLDVVAAGGEQPCDACQRAGFVLQEDGDDMTHEKAGKMRVRTRRSAAE